VKIFKLKKNNIIYELDKIINLRSHKISNKIDKKVKNIIFQVKSNGDKALIRLSKLYDDNIIKKNQILVSKKIFKKYNKEIDPKYLKSFKIAIKNITDFHKRQLPKDIKINKDNLIKGILWKPIESVGLYVPGGLASYPSTLLMNVIPAKIAGVKRIVVMTPSFQGKFNPYTMALMDILGIDEVYQIGGAQAIAALAYGTETIKPVDKIFGPGNAYVSEAKKQVFGKVGIDIIAGPSEIIVVADKKNNPSWVASDLIAQAEHDEKTQCILITNNENFAKIVKEKISILSKNLNKKDIIRTSLNNNGAILIVKNIEYASKIINIIAPEHVHLQNKLAYKIFKKINNAGCIFLGAYSAEAFGDYIVGTNHILPTSGSSKFSSGLGVVDYMKRTSYVGINKESFSKLSENVAKMASVENLDGHKLSIRIRQTKKKKL
tara:strand:+ start:325 stop:1626 length:1302 start_codon:yes stop_codon:yes gene_type:complete